MRRTDLKKPEPRGTLDEQNAWYFKCQGYSIGEATATLRSMRKLHDLEMSLELDAAWSFTRSKTPTEIVQEVFNSEKRKLAKEEEVRKKAEAARRRQITLNGLARLKQKKSQ